MLSTTFAAPLRIKPRFSRRLAVILALIHGGALLFLLLSSLPPLLKLALLLLILWSAIRAARYHLWLGQKHPLLPAELVLQNNVAQLDDEQQAKISPTTYVQPWLIVLNLNLPGRKRCSLVLFPDALDEQTFRRLRVRLKYPINE